jgi:hypothetical protein
MSTGGGTLPRQRRKKMAAVGRAPAEERSMEKKVNVLIAIAAVQALCLTWLCLRSLGPLPSPAFAGDAQEVQIVDHRISRYNPLPVTIRNDDAIRVKCVD